MPSPYSYLAQAHVICKDPPRLELVQPPQPAHALPLVRVQLGGQVTPMPGWVGRDTRRSGGSGRHICRAVQQSEHL